MIIAQNQQTKRVVVIATDRNLPKPMTKDSDGNWSCNIPDMQSLLNDYVLISDQNTREEIYQQAKNEFWEMENPNSENTVLSIIDKEFSKQKSLFESWLSSEKQTESISRLTKNYFSARNKIIIGKIDSATRRFYEIITYTEELDNTESRNYVRLCYFVLVWIRFCQRNNLNNSIERSPIDQLRSLFNSTDGQSAITSYLSSKNDELLLTLSKILVLYNNELNSTNPRTGSTLFGEVEAVNKRFGQIVISLRNQKNCKVLVSSRDDLNLWASLDLISEPEKGSVIAVNIRQNGENVGTRRGQKFVSDIFDTFFPIDNGDPAKSLVIFTGASNSYAAILCRSKDKSRILHKANLIRQVELLCGLRRSTVISADKSYCANPSTGTPASRAALCDYINSTFEDLIIDDIGRGFSRIELRLRCESISDVNPKKIKTFDSLTKKVFPRITLTYFIGLSKECRERIEYSYYKNSPEVENISEMQA